MSAVGLWNPFGVRVTLVARRSAIGCSYYGVRRYFDSSVYAGYIISFKVGRMNWSTKRTPEGEKQRKRLKPKYVRKIRVKEYKVPRTSIYATLKASKIPQKASHASAPF